MTAIVLAYLTGALTVMCWNGSWFLFDDFVFETRAFFGAKPLWYTVRPEVGWQTSTFSLKAGALVLDGEPGSTGGYYARNDTAYVTARYTF